MIALIFVLHSYQWYCHVDDDVYVNVPQLSHFLQQYDSHKPYYLGKWPGKQRGGEVEIVVSVASYVLVECVLE